MTELVVNYTLEEDGHWSVVMNNGVYCGTFEMDVDGYFYYLPVDFVGYWPSWFMKDLANKLDEINKDVATNSG